MKQRLFLKLLWASIWLYAGTSGARDYYVSASATSGGDGSAGSPFQTIQQAASVLQAGDICYIHAGIYRETVKPANSGTAGAPITFTAMAGDSVYVSGCDLVSGWQHFEGNIYQAPIGWTLGVGCNQTFLNGRMLLEARYPNGTTDLLHPKLASTTTHDNQTVTFAALTQPNNAWKGAIYWGKHAPNWAVTSGIIGSSSPGKLTCTNNIGIWWFSGTGQGCVIGSLAALDTEEEFYNDGSHLFLYAAEGSDPSSKRVEAKRRALAFNCSGKANIVIKGLFIRAATVNFGNAQNCLLEDCSVLYPTMSTGAGQQYSAWSPDYNGGVFLSGKGNKVLRCTVAYSAHCGIVLDGANQIVENCLIHDVDWVGGYQAAIEVTGGSGHQIVRNTMYNTGRSIINLRGATDINVDILSNHLYNYGYLTDDLGVIYSYQCNGKGSKIAYNWVHDNMSHGLRIGIYLDNVCGKFMVYRNVVWNCTGDAGIRVNLPAYGHQVFNNSLFNTQQVGANSYDSGTPCPTGETCTWEQGNNYLSRKPADDFMDKDNYDFRPKPDSPLIDKGKVFSPYTDNYLGSAPDLGAYESGGDFWRAGHDWNGATYVERYEVGISDDFQLGRNFPNPFNSATVIEYNVGRTTHIQLSVYDVLGRHVRMLIDQKREPGWYSTAWDGIDDYGKRVGSGIYFFAYRADGFLKTRKILLVK